MWLFQQHATQFSTKRTLTIFPISITDVLNSFTKNLFNVKSIKFILFTELHTSNAYNNTGKHFCFNNCTKTSSEASLPILAKMLFAAWWKDRWAWSMEHLNFMARTNVHPDNGFHWPTRAPVHPVFLFYTTSRVVHLSSYSMIFCH